MIERPLPISNDGLKLAETAVPRLHAICAYPNDHKSQEDYFNFRVAMNSRLLEQREKYEPSRFVASVETLLAKGEGQKAAAGLVTLYLYRLLMSGVKKPKVSDAAKQAEKHIEAMKAEIGPYPLSIPWREGRTPTVKMERIASAANNLEIRFREFCSIGCLMAARMLKGVDSDDEQYSYADANLSLAKVLASALIIEDRIYTACPQLFPNPWSVRATNCRQIFETDGAVYVTGFPLYNS